MVRKIYSINCIVIIMSQTKSIETVAEDATKADNDNSDASFKIHGWNDGQLEIKNIRSPNLAAIVIQRIYRARQQRIANNQLEAVIKIQAWVRGYQFRTRLKCRILAALVIQSNFRRYCQRKYFFKLKRAATILQKCFRRHKAKCEFQKIKRATITIQNRFRHKRRWKASIKIQSWFRGCALRRKTKVTLSKAIVDHQGDNNATVLLVIGGFDPRKSSSSIFSNYQIWCNKLKENRWELVGRMIKPLRYPGYALREHKIYVTGGWDTSTNSVSRECYILNLRSCKWSIGPKLNNARHRLGSCSSGNIIAVFGGFGSDNQLLDSIEILNGESQHWMTCKTRLNQPRAAMAVVESNEIFGRLIWLCGGIEYDGQQFVSCNEIQCYDWNNDQMVTLKFNLLSTRSLACATVCERTIYVLGGIDGQEYVDDIEAFRLESLKPTRVGALSQKRRGACTITFTFFVLTENCVVIVGGRSQEENDTCPIEIFSKHHQNVHIGDLPKQIVGFGCFTYQPCDTIGMFHQSHLPEVVQRL
ncbi:Kelch-like protein 12 [Chamberlinius hualienensis]